MDKELFSTSVDQKKKQEEAYASVLKGRSRPKIDDQDDQIELVEKTTTDGQNNLKSYSFDEALDNATKYFNGDDLAANVWINKYALKDSDGNLYESTPDDMHRRLAHELARIEKKYPNPLSEEKIFSLLRDFKYIVPQGSPMAGIGNNFQVGSLSNCFVIGESVKADSYGSILKVDQEQVQLMKRRGGVGHDLSGIRPKGSPVKNSALTSTGIVPFMERYSNSTREVAQDGRRGALMLSISVKHPDSESFIDAKLETGKVTGANISVKITDEFMEAVKNDTDFQQQFPVNSKDPSFTKTIRARDLWDKIVNNAWKSAEPGILFWDTIAKESVPDCYIEHGFETVSTNPCGEIPLCAYDSCRLLAINLYSYVKDPFTPEATFNAQLFIEHVHYAQRLMDDIVDLEKEKIDKILEKIKADPEEEEIKRVERKLWESIKHKTNQGRRTGIGITAEGDMLAALGVKYGTDKATAFSVEVHKTLAIEAYHSSIRLAKDRGAFPIFDYQKEINNPFIQRIQEHAPKVIEEMKEYGRRNIALLTIAPTGTTSLMTQTSSGIEPVYLVNYKRRRKVNPNDQSVNVSFVDEVGDAWEEYNVFHHNFITWLNANGYDKDEVTKMDDADLAKIIETSPYYGATANDVDWLAKVQMQGAVQKWVDHSISVTVNLPSDASVDLIGQIYETAWNSGCKGMTVYRDGSRSGVLVSAEKEKEEEQTVFKETMAPSRPVKLEAEIIRFQNAYEKWIAVVGILDGRPYEIFTGLADDFYLPTWVEHGWVIKNRTESGKSRFDFEFLDKQGYLVNIQGLSRSFNKEYWNYAKLISGILRHGMPLPFVVNIVSKLSFEVDSINTWKNGVERALKKFIPDGFKVEKSSCPECHQEGLIYAEGCLKCPSCGYSKCG